MKNGLGSLARALARDERGVAAVELALVAPLLLTVMLAAIEVGRFADYTIRVTNGARAGVQYGAQNLVTASSFGNAEGAALADTNSAPGVSAGAAVFCTHADGSADADCSVPASPDYRIVYVRVTTTGTLTSLFGSGLLPAALSSITGNGAAIMRVAE